MNDAAKYPPSEVSRATDKLIREAKDRLRFDMGNDALLALLAELHEFSGAPESAKAIRIGRDVASRLRIVKDREQGYINEYEKKLAEVKALKAKLRIECPHPVTHYEPDASGNNDSTTTCLCCGRDL